MSLDLAFLILRMAKLGYYVFIPGNLGFNCITNSYERQSCYSDDVRMAKTGNLCMNKLRIIFLGLTSKYINFEIKV